MGCRNLVCIYYKNKFVIAQYSQGNGEPQFQGAGILEFLRDPLDIQRLKTGLVYIDLIDEKTYYDIGEEGDEMMPPSLSCNTGYRILRFIVSASSDNRLPVFNQLDFANDEYFCEWAYVVDLDQDRLEVFGGCAPKPEAGSQTFANVGGSEDTVPRFLKSFNFADLPATEEFVDEVDRINDRYNF